MATDREEIVQLVYAAAECIDAGDFAGYAEFFAQAQMTVEGIDEVWQGRDAALRLVTETARLFDNGTTNTKHLMTNVIVEVDEANGTGTSRAYFTVLQAIPGEMALQPISSGRQFGRFAREDGAWRFTALHAIMDLMGDLGRHFPVDDSHWLTDLQGS